MPDRTLQVRPKPPRDANGAVIPSPTAIHEAAHAVAFAAFERPFAHVRIFRGPVHHEGTLLAGCVWRGTWGPVEALDERALRAEAICAFAASVAEARHEAGVEDDVLESRMLEGGGRADTDRAVCLVMRYAPAEHACSYANAAIVAAKEFVYEAPVWTCILRIASVLESRRGMSAERVRQKVGPDVHDVAVAVLDALIRETEVLALKLKATDQASAEPNEATP